MIPPFAMLVATCFPFPALMRNDKYEGKPLYWVEEEIEAEWVKSTKRSQTETGEYQTTGSLSAAMAEASAPVTLDMQSVAGGRFVFPNIVIVQNRNWKNSQPIIAIIAFIATSLKWILIQFLMKKCISSRNAGMPGVQGRTPVQPQQRGNGKEVFPMVLKDDLPSDLILRYMEGVTRRSQKLTAFWFNLMSSFLKP